MFTTEQLSYAEQVSASGIAVPTVLKHSRIALRVLYDASLVSAVSAALHRDSIRRPIPHLGRPLLVASLIATGVGSLASSFIVDADSAVGLAVFVAAGFASGLISAVHGAVFALVASVLGITGMSVLFESSQAASSKSTANPLTISLLVVMCCFVPLLAATFSGSQIDGRRSLSQKLQSLGSSMVMFIIALKVSQELTSQISGVGVQFGAPQVWAPALIGAVIPMWRLHTEKWLRLVWQRANFPVGESLSTEDTAWRREVERIVRLTKELRRGELLRPPDLRTRLTGTLFCALIISFIAYSYLQHAAAVVLICISFVLISFLHFPRRLEPERKWGELVSAKRVSRLRPIPSWATLLVPTVGAMVFGVVVAVLGVSANTAVWMSVGFSYAVFLFELYDVNAADGADQSL
jgi:hypothetical protein